MLGATLSIHSHMQNMSHGKCVENMCAKLFVDYPGSHIPINWVFMCKSIVYTIFFNLPIIVILLRVADIHYYEFGGRTCFSMCMAPPLSQFTPTHNVTQCASL